MGKAQLPHNKRKCYPLYPDHYLKSNKNRLSPDWFSCKGHRKYFENSQITTRVLVLVKSESYENMGRNDRGISVTDALC